jgi:anti-anti-sigma factor
VTPGTRPMVISPSGARHGEEAAQLATAIDAAVDSSAHKVVVDLRRCAAIDSSGLGILLRASRRLRAEGRALEVIARSPEIRRLFRVTGLDRQLSLV